MRVFNIRRRSARDTRRAQLLVRTRREGKEGNAGRRLCSVFECLSLRWTCRVGHYFVHTSLIASESQVARVRRIPVEQLVFGKFALSRVGAVHMYPDGDECAATCVACRAQ